MPNPIPPGESSETIAEKLLAEDRHYVKAVTSLGDRQVVVATKDISGSHGIKLVAKGTRIDSHLLEKLSGHQLRPNLDNGLAMENSVTPESLAVATGQLIDEQPFWQHLADKSGDSLALRHGLASIKLPEALAFKLTVAREQRPLLFRHTLAVAMVTHYLALRLGLNDRSTHNLLLAALCHDLGEMHTDPAILDPGHRITDDERRFVYVHPATGYVILRDIPGMPPEVARAVFHHHERLDGSGYPNGLKDGQIEALALPLMVAETAASVMSSFADYSRLSTLLRLNQGKYDGKSVALLLDVIPEQFGWVSEISFSSESRRRQLLGFAKLLDEWSSFRQSLDDRQLTSGKPGLGLIQERLHNLKSLLNDFGFDPNSVDALITLAETDPEVATELSQVLDELQFQLAEIAREIDRRGDEISASLPEPLSLAYAGWRATLQKMLERS